MAGVDATGKARVTPGGAYVDSTIVVAAAQRGKVVRIEVRGPFSGGDPVHEPIVRGIVRAHDGVLQTHEVPGTTGSAYVLELPLGGGSGTVDPAAAASEADGPAPGPTSQPNATSGGGGAGAGARPPMPSWRAPAATGARARETPRVPVRRSRPQGAAGRAVGKPVTPVLVGRRYLHLFLELFPEPVLEPVLEPFLRLFLRQFLLSRRLLLRGAAPRVRAVRTGLAWVLPARVAGGRVWPVPRADQPQAAPVRRFPRRRTAPVTAGRAGGADVRSRPVGPRVPGARYRQEGCRQRAPW